MMLCHSDSHVHFDLWVRRVPIDTKILELKIIDAVNFVTSNDLEGGEGAWLSSKLQDNSIIIFYYYNTYILRYIIKIIETGIQHTYSYHFKSYNMNTINGTPWDLTAS